MDSPSEINVRASLYAGQHHVTLGPLLGSGKDGTVWKTHARTAVKVFLEPEPFTRELAAYRRLQEHEVAEICGHAVPELIDSEARLLAIEMSIVRPPYVLDFASARLDHEAIEFPQHVLEEHEQRLQGLFGANLPKVAAIRDQLERLGIHMTDIHPRNIAFADM